eukprot:284817556_6
MRVSRPATSSICGSPAAVSPRDKSQLVRNRLGTGIYPEVAPPRILLAAFGFLDCSRNENTVVRMIFWRLLNTHGHIIVAVPADIFLQAAAVQRGLRCSFPLVSAVVSWWSGKECHWSLSVSLRSLMQSRAHCFACSDSSFSLQQDPNQISSSACLGIQVNACNDALDKHVRAGSGSRIALYWDSPVTRGKRSLSYEQLLYEVCAAYKERYGARSCGTKWEISTSGRLAGSSAATTWSKAGRNSNLHVCFSLPPSKYNRPVIPEAVVSMLACARIGAPHAAVFGGFGHTELNEELKPNQKYGIEERRPPVQ